MYIENHINTIDNIIKDIGADHCNSFYVFNKIDLLLLPTSPSVAFEQKEKLNNILEMYLSDIFTIPMSLAGIPSINIPIGKVTDLPIGIQACSNYFEESKIFSFTQYIEDHHIKYN